MSELSEIHGGPPPDSCRPLLQMFTEAVSEFPNNLALSAAHQPAGLYGIPNLPLEGDDEFRQNPYLRCTYKDLHAGVQRCITGLLAAGVKPGMTMFTFNTNGLEHVLAYWAAVDIGCLWVPINPRNLANKEEVLHMIKTARSAVPNKGTVLMTSSPDTILPLEDLGVFQESIKIVVSTSPVPQGWLSFNSLMSQPLTNGAHAINGEAKDKIHDGIVLFTSGTTSLPKGCLRTYPQLNHLFESMMHGDQGGMLASSSRMCCVLPNNHGFGHYYINLCHAVGAAIVYPGPAFAPDLMLSTLYREKITNTAMVPTMMHALIGLKAVMGHKLDHLESVLFGGASVSPEHLQQCIDELGTKGVENVFGMTEGIAIRTLTQSNVSNMVDGKEVTAGWVHAPHSIRVADPDTNEVVPRNTFGELHGSGPGIGYYIGDVGRDSFYNDPDGRLWFRTGDQARIDSQGRLFITGRYKEMIIRGGENISPAAIEAAILKEPQLVKLNAQIVGAPDAVAGEVPIAVVVGKVDGQVRRAVQDAVVKHMGMIYVPDDVISLKDLGLEDFPRTMAGKVQKTKVAALVKQLRAKEGPAPATVSDAQLIADVKQIWAKALGLEPDKLSLDSQIGEFADSITVMRVRDTIRRRTGKTLTLRDMATVGTVSGQIELLKQQTVAVGKKENKRSVRAGPPDVEDMAHIAEDPDLLEPTKELVLKAISPLGLDWADVEDVLPSYDFNNVMVETGLFNSWGFKMSLLSKKTDKEELRKAFETVLQNNRVLASFFVRDKELLGSKDSLHIFIRQDKKFFDKIFHDGGKVKSAKDLRVKSLDYHGQVSYPGPLARIDLYDVEETGTTGVVFCIDHAVIDASTGLIFSADLDKALGSTTPLAEHVDYKLWAESYYNQRTSPAARAATKWHVKRLKDIGHHRKALWPPFTMPNEANEYIVKSNDEDAVLRNFDAPGVHDLRHSHPNITAAIVVKAALALLVVSRTNYSHALFANLEAARTTFPFLPKAIEASGDFEATDVTGPTIQAVTNLIEFKPEETVLSLLERMQEDQHNLTKHASAPVREIIASLGDDGDMVTRALGHNLFNWTPGMGATGTNPNQNFEFLNAIVRPRLGLSWNAGLGGPDGHTFFLAVRGISFNKEEQGKLLLELEKISQWLLAKENWSSPVSGYRSALS